MKLFCDETNKEESTSCIEGKDYWTVQQFADLTQRACGSIRVLVITGNRLRKLLGKNINGRLYIEAQEIFEFPFVTKGQPANEGDYIEKYYLEEGNPSLLKEEKLIKRTKVELAVSEEE